LALRSPFTVAIVAAVSIAAPSAHAEPTPEQSAYCVAALKVRAEPLAQRVRRGDPAAEEQLLPIVTDSFAFIGSSYKQGVDSAKANELLAAAEKAQTQLPRAELAKIQDACQAQGRQLFSHANVFERAFVARAARNRIERLRQRS
jgi:hypothetical protein